MSHPLRQLICKPLIGLTSGTNQTPTRVEQFHRGVPCRRRKRPKIKAAIIGCLFPCILPIPPRHSGAHLLEVRVACVDHDNANSPPAIICGLPMGKPKILQRAPENALSAGRTVWGTTTLEDIALDTAELQSRTQFCSITSGVRPARR